MAMYEKRTDLAIEARESFPGDHVEVEGVILRESKKDQVRVTTVEIKTQEGAQQMKKPVGTYVTLEFPIGGAEREACESTVVSELETIVWEMLQTLCKRKKRAPLLLVSGLGNRFATPDALGPYVLENIPMNRHISREPGLAFSDADAQLCGISPGVMSQTGMESREILKGIAQLVKPDALLVIDSLASRSVSRLCRTIQITDTGICPGAGIGNNRNQITEETIGVPVIAIGVPTVVDAGTIIYEALENALTKEGYTQREVGQFFRSITTKETKNLFVTPKDIDEELRRVGGLIAAGVTGLAKKAHTI